MALWILKPGHQETVMAQRMNAELDSWHRTCMQAIERGRDVRLQQGV
jgi:hypothetical protein